MRLTRFFILLLALLIMSACSSEEDPEESAAESGINQEEETVEEEDEDAEAQVITLGNVEPIDFSEMDENEALRIEQSELNEPTLAKSYHNKLYYFDGIL